MARQIRGTEIEGIGRCFPMPLLTSLLSRSSCTLSSLSWVNIPTMEAEWFTLLQSLPSLSALFVADQVNFRDILVSLEFLERLQWPCGSWGSPKLLPSLAHLSLETLSFDFRWTPQLIRTLQSRCLPAPNSLCDDVACLKDFKLDIQQNLVHAQFSASIKQ
ncbi:hypothetical protein C8J56DRAFT_917057 [Mycena floridula]|nr:hypothetical protein C8J56DRAFT_917057 [Mycena floridula]